MIDLDIAAVKRAVEALPSYRNQMLTHLKQCLSKLDEIQLKDVEDVSAVLDGLKRLLRRTYPPVTCEGGQHGEDGILADLLHGNTGIYVDIGAADPAQCSNTWHFYRRGWRGLLIEPLPEFWWALLMQRPGDLLVPVASSDVNGTARMSVRRTLSSLRSDWENDAKTEVVVHTETLRDTLGRYPCQYREKCRLCSIDVEGHERAVLRGIDWKTFRPEVFVIEYRDYNPKELGADLSPEWNHILFDHNYVEVARTELNIIYQAEEFIQPVST